MAKITINGQLVKVKNGTTILQAVNSIGLDIPTLCFIEEINEIGFCRICVVEVEGEQDLVSACNTEIKNGMKIHTDSDKVIQSREATLQLLASRHRFDCWRCPKDGMCEFYDLLKSHDVVFDEFGPGKGRYEELIPGSGISQDQTKCVLCKRCVAVCQNVVTANVLKFRDDDGINPVVSPTPGLSFDESGCVFCGQCVNACPTGTLFETSHTDKVIEFLRDKDGQVVVQLDKVANSAIAEEFGYPIETPSEETIGKTYKALEILGFDYVTNTDLGTDYHMLATAQEYLNREEEGGSLPMILSSCPSATRYLELYKPELLEHIATIKSPHITGGVLIKQELLKKVSPKVVTVGTCTAAKYEITRDELKGDVDAVLTVRELAKLIKQKGIDYKNLDPISPNKDLTASAPPVLGGALVGVTNAIVEQKTETPLSDIEFKTTRSGLESDGTIEEATLQVGEQKLLIARVKGGAAFKEMFTKMEKKQYHIIEFNMCPGGCLNGGGMPIRKNITTHDVIKRRIASYCNQQDNLPLSNPLHNQKAVSLFNKDIPTYIQTNYTQKDFTKE